MSLPNSQTTAHPKSERSYSIEGLSEREGLVLKSMMRLLSHRTECVWVYRQESSELKVVSDQVGAAHAAMPWAQQVLTLGVIDSKRVAYLRLPLHANELEAELNRLGRLIVPNNNHIAVLSTAPGRVAARLIEELGCLPERKPETEAMRLLRWPPASLLATPDRVRMATLLISSRLSLYALQQRSGASFDACALFFEDLKKANLLTIPAQVTEPLARAAQPVAPGASDPPGLFARIRSRLGLQKASLPGQVSSA